ncbi:DHS-like NAD/FAD-binding domain-containing protein [Mycena capillaripes]|nr:DHS-like NAD/FAD-binding domain-containing protein [Mycena capillaripes]
MSSDAVSPLQAEVNRLRLELQTLKAQNASEPIEVGNYLLTRLEQLKVTKMFVVPGNFNLGFLDLVEDHHTIDWVGNCNELNAAYAADGYACVKEHSIGVVLTTFGVGKLSAINGVAGAFSGMVPDNQKAKALLHHTLGDGRYDAYIKAAENFTIAQGIITDKDNAAATIDRGLTDCIARVPLPTNLVFEKISSERLKIPLSRTQPPNDPEVEEFVVGEIGKLVSNAEDEVVILVDACAIRHDVREEVDELAKRTGFPACSAPMGKIAVSESYERYGWIYVGSISNPDVKEKVESAKLILSIGCVTSDSNTANFTYGIPTSRTVELHSDHTKIQHAVFPAVGMKQLLPRLTAKLEPCSSAAGKIPVPEFRAILPQEDNEIITHTWLWPRVSKFFRPKDVLVAETGTSNFGILEAGLSGARSVQLSRRARWGSSFNGTNLFIGDGSIQLTVQELSVMIHHGLKPIIFLINNEG